MSPNRLGAGVRTGIVAAAATAGAIVGFGWRHDAASRPFEIAGRYLLAPLTGLRSAPSSGAAVTAGIVLHVTTMVLLGVCFTIVAASLRGVRLVAASLLFAAAAWALVSLVVPSPLRAVASYTSSVPQAVFVNLLLALSLVSGMRLALLDSQDVM